MTQAEREIMEAFNESFLNCDESIRKIRVAIHRSQCKDGPMDIGLIDKMIVATKSLDSLQIVLDRL